MRLGELKNKSVVIVGWGREGRGIYNFLKNQVELSGLHVCALDYPSPSEIDPELLASGLFGKDYLALLKDAEVIIKSPGIPPLPEFSRAVANGAQLTSVPDIFLNNYPGVTIGVTGTKGKSTTSALISHLLNSAGREANLVGNVGVLPLELLLASLESPSSDLPIAVYELSSFQLLGITRSPEIAVLLNIYPEHLDYHGSLENYLAAKSRIASKGCRALIYDAQNELAATVASKFSEERIPFDNNTLVQLGVPASSVLPGRFNERNIAAALLAVANLGIPTSRTHQFIQTFKPLDNRLELVGSPRGVDFYDASLATIPEATIAHLELFNGKVHTLMAGGYDRGLDFSSLGRAIADLGVKALALFPTTGELIREALPAEWDGKLEFFTSMEIAVQWCIENTPPGKIVLHSPASPSFSLFKDYSDRSAQLKSALEKLL